MAGELHAVAMEMHGEGALGLDAEVFDASVMCHLCESLVRFIEAAISNISSYRPTNLLLNAVLFHS